MFSSLGSSQIYLLGHLHLFFSLSDPNIHHNTVFLKSFGGISSIILTWLV